MKIIEVTDKKLLKKFVDFPNKLYKNNRYYVPDMIQDAINGLSEQVNPAFEFCEQACFLAVSPENKILGRIGVLVNHKSNDKWRQKHARFSHFDFINDLRVSSLLMQAATDWAKARQMNYIKGPLGMTDMDHQGMLIDGFDELDMYITLYNAPYYKEHMKELGFAKDVDWIEFQITMPKQTDIVARKFDIVAKKIKRRYKYRVIDFNSKVPLLRRAEEIFSLYNTAYEPLYGTTKLTDKQIRYYIKAFLGFVNPRFIKVVVDEQDKLIGFGITMPSISRAMKRAKGKLFPYGFIHLLYSIHNNKRLDLYLIGVVPELRHTGVSSLIVDAILKEADAFQIKIAESGPMLEDNTKIQALCKHFETRQHRRRRSWIKEI